MQNSRLRWLSGIGATVLIGGLLAGCGSSDDAAIAQGAPTDLSGVTQNWDKNLPAAQRFVVLSGFANAAVLDKNTGLVWEKAPDTTPTTWSGATFTCINKNVGGQKGWRLPAIAELASLIDPAVASPGPLLPPGHPFTNVQSAGTWSATTVADTPAGAWVVFFNTGNVGSSNKANNFYLWCVRGGMNADQY